MIVLGIDPGLATVGIGLVEISRVPGPASQVPRLLDWCVITTAKGLPLPERLREISKDLSEILHAEKPDLVVVEKLYFATNRKTAMDVAEARGAILLTVQEAGVPVLEPTPLQLKLAVTGDGGADKRQVREMLLRILHLEEAAFTGGSDDATDAVALAVYGAFSAQTVDMLRAG